MCFSETFFHVVICYLFGKTFHGITSWLPFRVVLFPKFRLSQRKIKNIFFVSIRSNVKYLHQLIGTPGAVSPREDNTRRVSRSSGSRVRQTGRPRQMKSRSLYLTTLSTGLPAKLNCILNAPIKTDETWCEETCHNSMLFPWKVWTWVRSREILDSLVINGVRASPILCKLFSWSLSQLLTTDISAVVSSNRSFILNWHF